MMKTKMMVFGRDHLHQQTITTILPHLLLETNKDHPHQETITSILPNLLLETDKDLPYQETITTIFPHKELDHRNLPKANLPSNLEFNDRLKGVCLPAHIQAKRKHEQEFAAKEVKVYLRNWCQAWRHRVSLRSCS
ncbi:uncharacterized protein RBU33_024416 isoform 3-T4 [Hipposideros larvatus]